MLSGKGIKKGAYAQNVQLTDIYPTIINWFGDKKFQWLVGDSLIKNISGEIDSERVIYSDGANRIKQYSFIKDNIKVIIDGNNVEVYDLKNDPSERINLKSNKIYENIIKSALNIRKKYNKKHKRKKRESRAMSPTMMRRLKSLGYID